MNARGTRILSRFRRSRTAGACLLYMDPFERGRRAWPDVTVDRQRFLLHLSHHGGDVPCIEDLFLAFGCAEGSPTAIAAFERDELAALRRFVARIDAGLAAEVQRRVREYALVAACGDQPPIAHYSGRSRLQGWLRVVAVRCLVRRRRQHQASGSASRLVKLTSS